MPLEGYRPDSCALTSIAAGPAGLALLVGLVAGVVIGRLMSNVDVSDVARVVIGQSQALRSSSSGRSLGGTTHGAQRGQDTVVTARGDRPTHGTAVGHRVYVEVEAKCRWNDTIERSRSTAAALPVGHQS